MPKYLDFSQIRVGKQFFYFKKFDLKSFFAYFSLDFTHHNTLDLSLMLALKFNVWFGMFAVA